MRRLPLVLGIAVAALVLRVLAANSLSVIPASDETGYLADGLLLLEGLAPGYKHVPNAAIDWLVMTYAGLRTAVAWLSNAGDASTPALLRPLLAMERVLFADYADMSGLRLMVIVVQVAAGALAAGAIAWRGHLIAGPWGALLSGALAAATPIFVEYAAQTRAYSLAWSLALLAFAALAIASPPSRSAWTGALIGLAIATRIEMGLVLVPLLLELAQRSTEGGRRRAVLTCLGVAIVVFLAAAPWYITSLAGNLRQIISVRLLSPAHPDSAGASALWQLIIAGVGLPILASIVGLLLTSRGSGRLCGIAIGLWMALLTVLAMRPSLHGLRHEGALLLLSAVMIPFVVARAMEMTRAVAAVAGLLALHVGVTGIDGAWSHHRAVVRGDPVAWLEQHLPAGATIYWADGFRVPLPTAEASDRIWRDVASPDAWRMKYQRAAQRLELGDIAPRAMSEDPMQLERALRRRWFILGASLDTARPRFDVHLVAEATPFATAHADAIETLCSRGGTYVYFGQPSPRLGQPTVVWSPAIADKMEMIIYSFDLLPAGAAKRC